MGQTRPPRRIRMGLLTGWRGSAGKSSLPRNRPRTAHVLPVMPNASRTAREFACLVCALLLAGLAPTPAWAAQGAPAPVFGINMSLYDANDQLLTDPAVQSQFATMQVPYVRVPM